jgi:tetratricopeptide (TPR) repeat protein
MTLDEQIGELLETYQLYPYASIDPVESDLPSQPTPDVWLATPAPVTSAHRPFQSVLFAEADAANASGGHPETEGVDEWLDAAFDLSDPLTCALRKGLGYYDLLMYSDAIKSLELVAESTNNSVSRLYLAACHAAQNELDAAFRHLRLVRESTDEPLFLAAADELEALLHCELGNYQTALECLESVARRLPKYPDAWFNLGVCHFALRDFDQAACALARAVQLEDGDVDAWRLLGHVELRRGNYEAARSACQNGLEQQPLNLDLMHLLSIVERARGQYDACERICKRLLQLDPNYAQAWYLLAWLYAKTDKLDQARALLQMRLASARDDSHALLQLGIVCLLSGDGERAERLLMHCFPTAENKSLLWMALGQASALSGQVQQAKSRYLRAMRDTRKPIRRLAMYHYGLLLLNEGQYRDAETYLKGAALLGTANAVIYSALALCAERQGRAHEAEKLHLLAQSERTRHEVP